MQVPGVPEAVSRKAYTQLVEAYGFNPSELVSLEFRPDGIYASVYASDAAGHRMVDTQTEQALVHRVYVRVDDDAE